MLPQTYILLIKGSVVAVGVFLIILGVFLLLKKQKGDFELSFSLLDKVSTKLKGADAGLMMVLLGAILVLAVLLIRLEVEMPHLIKKKIVPPLKNAPLNTPDKAFGEGNND